MGKVVLRVGGRRAKGVLERVTTAGGAPPAIHRATLRGGRGGGGDLKPSQATSVLAPHSVALQSAYVGMHVHHSARGKSGLLVPTAMYHCPVPPLAQPPKGKEREVERER